MALEFSTAGITLKYAVETVAGTRPTSGYTGLPDIVSMSDVNPAPNMLDVTNLADLEWTRAILGLKDGTDAFTVTVNGTKAGKTTWETCISAAESGLGSGLATWFEIIVPGYTESFYFAGVPSSLGFFGADVDSVYRGDIYISKTQIEGWNTSST